MKATSKLILIVSCFSSFVIADENPSVIKNVDVFQTKDSTLSIQNLSIEDVKIEIYGEVLDLSPTSGIQFECSGYENVELQIKNNDHEYFEVPCQSRVIFNEVFKNQYSQGE